MSGALLLLIREQEAELNKLADTLNKANTIIEQYRKMEGEKYMGCDIHLQCEVLVFDSEEQARRWVPVNLLGYEIGRSYALFGLLAGVRGHASPISGPRGLPRDCHPVTRELIGDPELHTPSWLTLDEMRNHRVTYSEIGLAWIPFGELLDALSEAVIAYDVKNDCDVRIVFAFDS